MAAGVGGVLTALTIFTIFNRLLASPTEPVNTNIEYNIEDLGFYAARSIQTYLHRELLIDLLHPRVQIKQTRNTCNKNKELNTNCKYTTSICIRLLLLSGDVSLYPGPVKFPCGTCEKGVRKNQRAIQCDDCNVWFHLKCIDLPLNEYELLGSTTDSWFCKICYLPDFSDSYFIDFNEESNAPNDSLSSNSTSGVNKLLFQDLRETRRLHPKNFIAAYVNINSLRYKFDESCDFPEGLLILYRTGIFSIDATTTQLRICPKHRDFYGIHWKNKSARCQHPDHPSSSKAKADGGSSPLLCKQNWLYTRQIIPVGTGLCKQCSIKMKNFVKSDKTQVKLNIEEDVELFERLCGHISSIHEDKEDTDLDLDSQLSFLSTTTLTELSQQSTSDWEADNASGRDKFNRAMNILGNGKFPTLKHQLKLPWDDVSKSTKAMYLKFTSDVVNLIIQYIAPGQENKIMADLSEKYMYLNDDNQTTHDDMTKALIQAYLDQNNSQTQIQILSLFVQKFTKQKLIELIPGLTMSKIDRARKHANLEKPGQMINSPRIYRMRLSHPQLMHFIEFISSPSYHQAVGYGSKTLQLSSGVEMKIPKVVRSIISSRLIKTYMAYCKDQDYDTFSRSTLYNILNVCIASQKKNLHGLDNTTADGMKAMDTLTDIINKLQLFGLEEEKVEKLKNIFASANQHLKFEIKGHLATSSTCLDHCTTFSLSDSKSTQFRSTCAHEHSEGCTKCSIIDKSLLELSNTFQTMNSIPAEIVDEIDHDLSRAQEQIMTWKAHCVRTVHQDQAKQTVLGNLKPHQALIVMDWAMKFLPVRHREAQSDFFGKKGVSWHVSSVVTLDIEAEPEFKTDFNVHTLVNILELGNQGWFSVAHIITDLLQKLPLILPLVTEIFLKSDNAGCYHCVPLISYIQNINVL